MNNPISIALLHATLPMVILLWPLMLLSLLPSIAVKTWIIKKDLELKLLRPFKVTAIASTISITLAIPFTYLVLMTLNFALVASPIDIAKLISILKNPVLVGVVLGILSPTILVPVEPSVPYIGFTSGIFLLVLFFFVSWKIEYQIARWMLQAKADVPLAAKLNLAFKRANLISYAGLIVIWIISSLVLALVTA